VFWGGISLGTLKPAVVGVGGGVGATGGDESGEGSGKNGVSCRGPSARKGFLGPDPARRFAWAGLAWSAPLALRKQEWGRWMAVVGSVSGEAVAEERVGVAVGAVG